MLYDLEGEAEQLFGKDWEAVELFIDHRQLTKFLHSQHRDSALSHANCMFTQTVRALMQENPDRYSRDFSRYRLWRMIYFCSHPKIDADSMLSEYAKDREFLAYAAKVF